MKKIYTTKDIQDFLYKHGILWNGVNKNEQAFDNMILADVKFFDEKGYQDAEVYLYVNELTLNIYTEDCDISYEETTFSKSLIKDYSFDWTKTLLEKYPTLASNLKTIVESKMKRIHENAEFKIKPLQEKIDKIKEEEKIELEPLRNIRRLIKSPSLQKNINDNNFESNK